MLIVALSGCVTQGSGGGVGTKGLLGGLLGAGVGGYAGSNIGGGKGKLAATAIGVLAGAWLGNNVGNTLDDVDRLKSQKVTQRALERNPQGSPAVWSNPTNRTSGTTTPTRTYKSRNNEDCRTYKQSIVINDKIETKHGTACRINGLWVEQQPPGS